MTILELPPTQSGNTPPMVIVNEIETAPAKNGLLARIEEKLEDQFYDKNGEAYLTIGGAKGKPSRTVPVLSKPCAMLIRETHYRTEGKGIDTRKLEEIQSTLAAMAIFDGDLKEVNIRVARTDDGAVEIDLGDDTGNCVRVKAGEKLSIQRPTARFVRPEGFGSIAFDEMEKPDFDRIWKYVCVTDPLDRVLISSWLVMTLRGKGPFPILAIQGERGSAKSTTTRILRALVDPGRGETRGTPKSVDDLFIAAKGGHVLSFDNLSGMSHQLSDGFCRLSTGGAVAKRKLYTTGEEAVHEACRPVIFNGIDGIISKSDLHSRAVGIHLPRISEEQRQDEDPLWKSFEEDRSAIFVGLLMALKTALERVDTVHLDRMPRMADFGRFATAAEPGFGFSEGAVINALTQRQHEAELNNLDVDPVAPRIISWLKGDKTGWDQQKKGVIEGTVTEVWEFLAPPSDKPSNWPKTASHFSQHLARITPDLRSVGIIVERPPRASQRKAVIIRKMEESE
ncbi:MAG: hypothetical protein HQ508_00685 [Candidatus Marinimicrobia bacterium]|nr:hypothetical protein [Candidatus Neomarinimicrobiota bacterium]